MVELVIHDDAAAAAHERSASENKNTKNGSSEGRKYYGSRTLAGNR